jgi:hypothetical protein
MLEWVTRSENSIHAAKYIIKFSKKSISRIDIKTGKIIKNYDCLKSVSEDGLNPETVRSAMRKKNFYLGSYWTFTNPRESQEDLKGEIWYDLSKSIYDEVKCYPKYKVSNFGRIRGHNGKILKINFNTGYGMINLYNKNGIKYIRMCRLVLMACNVPNPENKPTVDHIDSNPKNDRLDNLRWATTKEQTQNSNTLEKISKGMNKIQIKVTKDGRTVIHEGIMKLEKEISIAYRTIKKYAELKQEYKGYLFEIIEKQTTL